ncbi:ABC transporter permease [Bifidobacterium crudilactis]|jgi:NitT/TauT family transport system permease protein|uniref:ABC transporter permease n=1 Tax=Bifidobacterium crudilactis TaxID=327277 RepID=UPI0023539DCF|nr:ABC transporter permease [Bifidobacterium crudilactis]MCI1218755.1 ABC transporter permease [Bifidobacterium crudilactis]MCI1644286.1 ABC transporter permease [Bifidobacterium crudilactis]MCI1664303.1 ABC transporter permease [Bifidobacterium crudilactis]MCI1889183.1 ABC transporter permease [Bifidobacterium crudilactis]MCI2149279.1 ABC transporter permease [Bifidobacterium crudilactis]
MSASTKTMGAPLKAAGHVLRQVLLALPIPLLILYLWHLGVAQKWELPMGIKMAYLSSPGEVVKRIYDLAFGGIFDDTFSHTLILHLWASTQRALSGFLIATVIAVPLGIIMGRVALANDMLDPLLNLLRPIPVTAWVPLALLIIGFGDKATIFLVFIACFFPILINTIAGVKQVPERLIEASSMLGTPKFQQLYKVVFPAALQSIISGLRLALGQAWVILVVAEQVGISIGLGSLITQARDMSKTDLVIATMLIIGLVGFLADRVLLLLMKVVTRNRPTLT